MGFQIKKKDLEFDGEENNFLCLEAKWNIDCGAQRTGLASAQTGSMDARRDVSSWGWGGHGKCVRYFEGLKIVFLITSS